MKKVMWIMRRSVSTIMIMKMMMLSQLMSVLENDDDQF